MAFGGIALAIALSGMGLVYRGEERATRMVQGDGACLDAFQTLKQNPYDPSALTAARQCAGKTDSARRHHSQAQVYDDLARLMGVFSMIPEYHDEQRLYSGGGNRLGPQAGIYVSPHLDDFRLPWQFEAHGNKGVLVAYVAVTRLPGEPIPPTYQALGLGFGLNCVWLIRASGDAQYSAVVRPAVGGKICDRNVAGGTTLTVVEKSYPGLSFDNYPAVARFDESTAGNPLIGVKCLAAWCEIGAGTFATRKSIGETLGPSNSFYKAPRFMVKGWYDEQLLSVPVWTAPNAYVFERTTLRAALVPEPGIENLQEGQFMNTWKPVAGLMLEKNPAAGSKYARWGLKMGMNKIELRYKPEGRGGQRWEARMWPQGATTPVPWSFNKREKHFDVGIPGTVRLRWTIMDDGVWAPCGQSCCQVEG
jgi:hypothetical protein